MKFKIFLGVAVVMLVTVSCADRKPGSQSEPKKCRTMVVQTGSSTLESKYSASLEGQQLVEIRPQVSGIITKICFEEGDKVVKGQPLFILDQVPYEAAVEVAEANVKSAEAQLATARLTEQSNSMLYERNVISEYELKTARNSLAAAEASFAQAKAQLTTARNNLSYTVVKSPVTGVAGMISYRVGALVGSSITTPMVTVSDDSSIYAYFSLSENMVLNLMQKYGSQQNFIDGMSDVKLIMSNGVRYPSDGRIDAVSGIVDQSTGAVRVRARFSNESRLLRSGSSASVIIPAEVKDAILIPQAATFEIQEKIFVYKVVDGKAVSTMVGVFKENDGTNYIVTSGLEEGDVIVAEGAGLLKDGTAIAEE